MKISDDLLMAYVDGELAPEERAQVEAAMAEYPEYAARVSRQQRLRARLAAQFEPVLQEPVPDRLLAAARGVSATPTAAVVELRAAAAARGARRPWSWPEWTALAASLLVGVLVARWLPPASTGDFALTPAGAWVARGALAQALDQQLASDPAPAGEIAVGLSFRIDGGGYCRSFVLGRPQAQAGLACRQNGDWRLTVLSEIEAPASGELRLAATALPAAVLAEIDRRLLDDPLDAQAERAARDAGWR